MSLCGNICHCFIGGCTGDKDVTPFLEASEALSQAQPTDLIEFKRKAYVHWGMYVGFDSVIHLCNMGDGVGKVHEELLVDIADGDKCRINNKSGNLIDLASLPGFNDQRSADEIIEEARKWLYPEFDLKYDVLTNNCEHVCMKWKYGVSKSEQVENAAKRIAGGILAGGAIVGGGFGANELVDAGKEAAKAAAEEEARAKADEEKEKAKEKAKEQAGGCVLS